MLDSPKNLGSDYIEGLQNLEGEDGGPAEDEDSDHHDQHWNNGADLSLHPQAGMPWININCRETEELQKVILGPLISGNGCLYCALRGSRTPSGWCWESWTCCAGSSASFVAPLG